MKAKLCFILLFFICFMQGADIGSDTAVTRFDSLQTVNDGDRIAGFAAIAAGFTFANLSVNGEFDSFFPVIGPVALNGGVLTLNQDLIFHENASIDTLGNIIGNGHVIELAPSMACVPDTNLASLGCDIIPIDTIATTNQINTVDWGITNTGFFAVGTDQGSSLDTVLLYSFDGVALTFLDSASLVGRQQTVLALRFSPTDLFIAVGTINQPAANPELFIYEITGGNTLTLQSSVSIGNGDITAIAWTNDGTRIVVGNTINNNEIQVFDVSAAGILSGPVLTVATGANKDVSQSALDFDATGEYLAVGFDPGTTDLRVYEYDPGTPSLTVNASATIGTKVLTVDWNKTCTQLIAIGVQGSLASGQLQVLVHDPDAGTITSLDGIDNIGNNILRVDWKKTGDCIAIAVDSPPIGNIQTYSYSKTASTLALIHDFDIADAVNTVRWHPSGNFLASGSDLPNIIIFETEENSIGEKTFEWSDVEIFLNCNSKFQTFPILFSGQSIINGRGMSLEVGDGFNFLVNCNSNLLLKHITITGLSGIPFDACDYTATYSFYDVTLILDDDVTFTQGHMHCINGLTIRSHDNSAFIYTSECNFTIQEFGRLELEESLTFSLAPTIPNSSTLVFEDPKSQLIMHGANFYSDLDLLSFTKGQLFNDGKTKFYLSGELCIGDGIDRENNFCMHFQPASSFIVELGTLTFKNVYD